MFSSYFKAQYHKKAPEGVSTAPGRQTPEAEE